MKGCMQYNRSYEPSGDLTVIISGKLKSRESQVLKGNGCTCTLVRHIPGSMLRVLDRWNMSEIWRCMSITPRGSPWSRRRWRGK